MVEEIKREMKASEWFFMLAIYFFAGLIVAIADGWVSWLIYCIGSAGIICAIAAGMTHNYDNKQQYK